MPKSAGSTVADLRPAKGTPAHAELAHAINADAIAGHPVIVRESETVRGLHLERRGRWITFRHTPRTTPHAWASYFVHAGRVYLMDAGLARVPSRAQAAIDQVLAAYAAQTAE